MKIKLSGVVGTIVAVLILLGALFPLSTPVAAQNIKPIVFVHGSAGSAAQFESQAMRFVINGYPANYLFAFEYDTSTPDTEGSAARMARLDAFIDNARASTGSTQVYLMGHSRGTYESFIYLAVPTRAAKVAKYVNIDGTTSATLPGGVPTLALWATKGWSYNAANQIVGATNVFIPNQTHVDIATSAESFVEMYKFLVGNSPTTNQISADPSGQVQLSGRAVFFPQNRGVGDGTLQIWRIDGTTGARIGATPQATYVLSGTGFTDGAWGPFTAFIGQNYEFVIVRTGVRPHHFYFEPFVRSNPFVRLLTSPPGGIGDLMERNLVSAALVINRNKEFWGNDPNDYDFLTINNTHIVNAATCPVIKSPGLTGVIGIFAYDRYLNGLTDLSAPIPTFFAVGFMTGVDIYMAAADPPTGTISLVLTPRGGGGKTQTVNIANWASLNHSVSVPFNDFIQTTPVSNPSAPPTEENPRASSSVPTPRELTPAQMSLQSMNINPQQASANEPVLIATNVVNTGDDAGTLNVTLKINGQIEQSRMVSVGPQDNEPVNFIVTKAQPGTYTVDVLSRQGSFTVVGEETSRTPASSGLIAFLVIAVLVLTTVVVLTLSFRRTT